MRVLRTFGMMTLLLLSSRCMAADSDASHLLPPSTVLFVQIDDPASILATLLDHPLRQRIESLDAYQSAWKKNLRQVKAVVAVLEAQLNMDWQDVVSTVTAGGLYAAVDAETNGIALLANSDDQAMLEKLRETLLKLIRSDAEQKGNPDPIKTGDYRGIQAFGINDVKLATFGTWLLMTNKDGLGKAVIDRFLEKSDDSLSHDAHFQAASESAEQDLVAWGFANVTALREAGAADDLFSGRTENILAEILVGGLQSNLQHTPYATASIELDKQHVSVSLKSPHDRKWITEAREYYFGQGAKGKAPSLIRSDQTVLSISAYREIANMWLRGDELLKEGAYDELAKAESNLSTLFSGKDFGEEILGAVGPEFQIVVNRQDFTEILPRPAIKLPSFAVAFRLRQAEQMRDDLRRTFQSLIGFLNVIGSSQGQPQLDMDVQRGEQRQVVTTSYVPEEDERESGQARINFNFSPSVAFAGDQFVVSSTSALVHALTNDSAKDTSVETSAGVSPVVPGTGNANTLAFVDMTVLRDVLHDNQTQLVAQNMLSEGNSKEESQQHINALLDIVGWFRDASLALSASDSRLTLEVQLRLADLDSP